MFPSAGAFFRRLFRIFDIILLFFNDFDLFPYRIHDIYFKKPSVINDVSQKVERPNQHIMADDFGISELVTLAPGFTPLSSAEVIYIYFCIFYLITKYFLSILYQVSQ